MMRAFYGVGKERDVTCQQGVICEAGYHARDREPCMKMEVMRDEAGSRQVKIVGGERSLVEE